MMKRVAIMGTRGIPNRYGGFEQFAEQISKELVNKGVHVTVYNPHYHPYPERTYLEVNLVKIHDPKILGGVSQFIYDLLSILHACRQKYDVIIQLGYTTSSIWGRLLPGRSKIIYNMDGLEWQREKYRSIIQSFLKYAERLAIKHADVVVADAMPIKEYLDKKYKINSVFAPYPVEIFNNPDKKHLTETGLLSEQYYLMVARFQPDNNIETVIRGCLNARAEYPLVIIGDHNNRYGRYLKKRYCSDKIIFWGGIYNKAMLDNLRYYSKIYFHGHSAGGTNPSLLEAMATACLIFAHDNIFNRSVLSGNAYFFKEPEDIAQLLHRDIAKQDVEFMRNENLNKLKRDYSIDVITDRYLRMIDE